MNKPLLRTSYYVLGIIVCLSLTTSFIFPFLTAHNAISLLVSFTDLALAAYCWNHLRKRSHISLLIHIDITI